MFNQLNYTSTRVKYLDDKKKIQFVSYESCNFINENMFKYNLNCKLRLNVVYVQQLRLKLRTSVKPGMRIPVVTLEIGRALCPVLRPTPTVTFMQGCQAYLWCFTYLVFCTEYIYSKLTRLQLK